MVLPVSWSLIILCFRARGAYGTGSSLSGGWGTTWELGTWPGPRQPGDREGLGEE